MPGYANPQNLNRYSYVRNNPLRYTDPTGHSQCQTQEDCEDMGTTPMATGSSGTGNNNNSKRVKEYDDDPNPDGISPISTTAPNLWPDYYIGSLFIPIYPPFPIFGVDISVVIDAYGNVYFNGGGGVSWGPSASAGGGWLLGPDNDHEYVVEGFLQGHSFNVSGGYGVGVGGNNVNPLYIQSGNEGSGIENNALEALVTSPGVTAVATFGWLIYDNGDDTPWIFQADK